MNTKLFLCYKLNSKVLEEVLELGEAITTDIFDINFKSVAGGNCDIYEAELGFKEEITVIDFHVQQELVYKEESKVFLNGWQTWSESKEFSIGDKNKKLNPLFDVILGMYGDYRFTDYKSGLKSWSYTYVRTGNDYKLIGALDEKDGFVKITHLPNENVMRISKDADGLVKSHGSLMLKFGIYRGNEDEVFSGYFDDLGLALKSKARTIGWTSWYNYYTSISQDIIMSNLKSFQENHIPLEIFQIDDGYQKEIGDWLEVNHKFPKGMKFIADSIRDSGYKAGLWLAPFVCTKKSRIYNEHYDWVAKDHKGRPIKAGFNPGWDGFFYAMDFYNEGFHAYLREVFSTVFKLWNFHMVKLDFLYSVTLLNRKDKTKGEMMHEAMVFLRECAGDKLILGCGVPLASAYNLVDYCRIGGDVGLTWEDKLLKGINYKERVSTVNSLRSTIGRRHLNNRAFENDPDVFIIREKNQKMSLKERKILLYLNMLLGGLIFTSDHIGEYSKEEMALYLDSLKLKDAEVLKVLEEDLIYVEIMLNGDKQLYIFNLDDGAKDVCLPQIFREEYEDLLPKSIEPRDMFIIYEFSFDRA